ncbi:MAG: TonB-dependent receptor [Bacteroidales bacterium]
MKRVKLLFTVISLFAFSFAFGQNIKVTGTVTDANTGEPIPYASIQVKGTMHGQQSDELGNYSIDVPSSGTLVFSSIGYTNETVVVDGKKNINVMLKPATQLLDDVIVVAYGTVRREAKTGSVTSVSGSEISESPVTSVDKMLAGKMAGVSITAATGQPGATSQIRVRGTSSINAGSDPLWVVDGIPVMQGDQSYFTNTSNAIAAINPNDIESITVLKDAAAASIYGSRAANGVILVTTKSGKEGKAKFTARAKYGASTLANDNNFGVMSAPELLDFQRTAAINAGKNPDDPKGAYYRPMSLLDGQLTDWIDHVSRVGSLQEYEINASAGSARSKYYSSLTYHRNEGIFYGIDYQRITFRINADHKLNDKLSTGTRINAAYTESKDVPMQSLYYTNPMWGGTNILPWTKPYNADGTHNVDIPENSNTNPRANAAYDDQWEKQYRVNGSFYLEYKPTKNITLKTTNALEGTFGEGRRYWSPDSNGGGDKGTLQTSRTQYLQLTTSNTIAYDNTFAEKHSLRVLVGQEAMSRTYSEMYLYSPDVDKDMPYPNTSTSAGDEGGYDYNKRTLLSFFGIVDYNYASKYYLQASVRYDGSSLFGNNKRWGLFYSVGGSWNMHNENFLKNAKFLSLLKLRASYGVNGNDNISPYRAYGVYSASQYNGVSGLRPSTPLNQDLSWELNKSWNVGADFGFFNNRLSGSVEYYNRITDDMLLDKNVPQTTGFSTNFLNIGKLTNRGVEIQLEGNIIQGKDWNWNVGFNIAFNKTKIDNLGDNTFLSYVNDNRLRHTVGMGMYSFYLKEYAGVDPQTGEAQWYDKDGSITTAFNKARYIYAGSPEPKYTGGFNTSLSWKGINLSAFFEFKGGNKVLIVENRYMNADGNKMSTNQYVTAGNYWKQPGDTNCNPKPMAGNSNSSYAFESTRWLQDGGYLRIKDITLSYNLPQSILSKIKLSNIKVYFSALNLYTFHNVDFYDPERGVTGMGLGIYPMTKSFIGGLEISF